VLIRRLRLATGLILFTYVSTHLANHALGLVSLEAAEAGRLWFLALWRSAPGTAALYGALLTHFALALVSLYRRRHLRMRAWEAAQLLLGLAIPPLLAGHVVGTRVAHTWLGVTDSYTWVLFTLWHVRPDLGVRQTLTLLVAWTHGCVGLHFWLRLRRGYARAAPYLLAGAVLLPTLALLGFVSAGRTVSALVAAEGPERLQRAMNAPTPAQREALGRVTDALHAGVGLAVAGVLAARAVRQAVARRRGVVQVTYPWARRVTSEPGMTVLETSRLAGIPHASVCGGRGRCSTCRVRVVRGLEALPAPGTAETRVLRRVGAPPNVRLACQLRPTSDVSVVPLLPATTVAAGSHAHRAGEEREVAVLFADLRQFTRVAERRLPYDVVFLLNRYFAAVGGAIERCGGVVNQFTGDGVMALFGVEAGPEAACRSALAAAREAVASVAALSGELAEELPGPLRIGIGIHVGPAVVGEMGHGHARYLTAVGDTVHVAARLQEATKHYDCQMVVSAAVLQRAGHDAAALPRDELSVRNRAAPVAICIVTDVRALAEPSV